MAWFELDESRRPLIVLRIVSPVPTDTEVDLMLARMNAVLARGEKYALVVQADQTYDISMSHRRAMGRWVRDTRRDVSRLCVAQGFAIPAIVSRLVLRSIFMIAGPPVPHLVVTTVEEAENFCLQHLDRRGLEAPL